MRLRRRFSVLSAAGLIVVVLAVSPADVASAAPKGPSRNASAQFTLRGTVPGAASQPTADGRRIKAMNVLNDRVYVGYGDWAANTGPITVSSLGATDTAFRAEVTIDTEAVETIDVVGGELVVPATDPRGGTADFAKGSPWSQSAPLGATHVFDSATLTGSDLWLVGSKGVNAVAWRSLDGGATWAESLVVPPAEAISFARFHFAAVLDGALYVQAVSGSTGADSASYVFDGTTWTRGASLIDTFEQGRRPHPFAGAVVYLTWPAGESGLLRSFDGQRSRIMLRNVRDAAVIGGTAYVLLADGTVKSSTNGKKWATIATAPAGAISITAASSNVYVGTIDSQVWSLAV